MRSLNIFIFLFGFITTYLLTNTYVIWRINQLLGNKFNKITVLLILFATGSYIVGALIDRLAHNVFTRILYGTLASWMGILMLLLFTLMIFEVVNFFFKVPSKIAAIAILSVTAVLAIYAVINAFSIKTKEITISIPNLKNEITIAQLTDLHVGTIHNSHFLNTVVAKVNLAQPDLTVITGDLVDGSGPLRLGSYIQLNDLKMPTYFVPGNHENYENLTKVFAILDKLDLTVLKNEKIETKGIQLIGINFSENRNDTTLDNIKIDSNKPSVLLAHDPNVIKKSSQKGIDLQLSGHTHNGQIIPFNFIVKLFYPRIKGLYEYNGSQLYVSPGTGTWGPPMRLGSNNEITLIHLVPQ